MADDGYGAVLRPGWQSELVRERHPDDGSRVFELTESVAAEAAEAGSTDGTYSDETVLLLHGVGNSGAIYAPVMSTLGRLGPVIAPTLSPALFAGDVADREAAVSSLVDWLAELRRPPWRVVGHSMGGIMTGLILRTRPEVISRAVLLNSPLPGTVERLRQGDTLDRNGRALLAMKGIAQITRFGRPRLPRFLRGTELTIVRAALGGFVKHPGRLHRDVIGGAILRTRTTDGIDFLRLARELPIWESEPFTERPVQIIVGDDDPLVPLEDHDALTDSYPEAEVHVADDCGHFVHLEHPRLTVDLIAAFLAQR